MYGVDYKKFTVENSVTKNSPSLRQKIGQLFILGFEGDQLSENNPIYNAIKQQYIGGVILFDYHFKKQSYDKNIISPTQLRHLTQSLQDIQKTVSNLPLIISIDYEGGRVNRLKENQRFPKTLSAQEFSRLTREQAHTYAIEIATTLCQLGINLNYMPVLDLAVNPNNPVIAKLERSFSNNTDVVTNCASLFARELAKKHILYVYKHFPGHGSSTHDSHLGFVDVTDTWQPEELQPYQALIKKNLPCPIIMSAHIVNRQLDPSGLPATLSKTMLTELLRKQMGFDGVIISDDMQMKAITEHYSTKEALIQALNAGVDILVYGNQLADTEQNAACLIDIVDNAVKQGEIAIERVDEAYRRVTQLKKHIQGNVNDKDEA